MDRTKVLFAVVIALLVTITAIQAQDNYMNVMTFMAGEFAGSEFGESMASLDFNGDGYMDLVVSSRAWNPDLTFIDQNRWGKLYFYWGGPNFDNIPDLVIPGTHDRDMSTALNLYNAGDLNGDGKDDLILKQIAVNGDTQVAVFFSRINPLTSPDVLLTTSEPGISIIPLGDINGDDRDDVAIIQQYSNSPFEIFIWSDYLSQPWLFKQSNSMVWHTWISGVGDVNGDGFDDCLLHMPINSTGQTHNMLVLYYGSPNFPVTDSLVICEDSNSIIKKWSCPVGDVNGDGLADFTAGSLVYDYRQNLWMGGNNLTPQWDVVLEATFLTNQHDISERGTGYPFVHGDVNGDGYQDVFGFDSEAGYYSGNLFLWMGSPNMNGSLDFGQMSAGGYNCSNFGWSKVTGDFNADGYCDVAVGAPWFGPNDHNNTGRVYILAGNADLHETTVANEDDVIPAIDINQWQLEAYPNPISNKELELHIKFAGTAFRSANDLTLNVFNLKGQKLLSQSIPADKLQEGLWTIETSSWAKGIVLLSITRHGKQLTSKKVTIL